MHFIPHPARCDNAQHSRVKIHSLAERRRPRHLWGMTTIPNTLALIGNTPLVRLAGPSAASGGEIFAKC